MNADGCRVSNRASSDPTGAVNGIGFRCAMTPTEP
jgi:hypothetical protein